MTNEKGNVSVSTENIFPIIRKWLYSDRDIFLREMVSNSTDAIVKMKKLIDLGEAVIDKEQELHINVTLDSENRKLYIEDNGIGMTHDEIKKYINQIAFSGAVDFVEKYKDKTDETAGIIGHFGLGFYSSFMVASKVRIDSLSYVEGSAAASWESSDGMAYEMGDSDKNTRGTLITIELNDESCEFINADKCREILNKYCAFMPYPIYFMDVKEEAEKEKKNLDKAAEKAKKKAEKKAEKKKAAEEAKKAAEEGGAGETPSAEESAEEEPEYDYSEPLGPVQINDIHPLWLKNPKDCTDEEYKAFYRKAFSDYREPLFWIHLNMDYPFNLKGILYFPQTDNTYESLDGRIKLFYNQVFVADNIKEVIPDFLFLLKGCIDCPDLPLNVSRSFLQNDGYVQKLSSHIIKKVADKLTSLFESSREDYDKYWSDIGVFVKYGCMKEEKFYDKVKDIILLKTVDNELKALKDCGEKIYYTNDEKKQVAYVDMAKSKGKTVMIMDHELDVNFMSFMEYKNNKVKFIRIDAEIEGEEGPAERKEVIEKIFRMATGDEKLQVQAKSFGEDSLAAVLSETEESRRMQEMQKMYMRQMGGGAGMDFGAMFPVTQILVVNTDSRLVGKLSALFELPDKQDQVKELALHIYDLARLGHGSLDAQGMSAFLTRSTKIMSMMADKMN
ncbi:MAG: molecular chaperone HtpG [Saccharofermentanales bacterium]